jgi:hypothetical protein
MYASSCPVAAVWRQPHPQCCLGFFGGTHQQFVQAYPRLHLRSTPRITQVSIMSTILLKKKFLDNGQVKTLSPEEYQVILDKLRNNMTVKAGLPYLRRVSEALVTVLLRMVTLNKYRVSIKKFSQKFRRSQAPRINQHSCSPCTSSKSPVTIPFARMF